MISPRTAFLRIALNALVASLVLSPCWRAGASAQELPPYKPVPNGTSTVASDMGRLYVFRQIDSFGAHIDDFVTIDGVPIHRVTPGTGFYCSVTPGDYIVSVARHRTHSLKVSVAAGQRQYIRVMLSREGGDALRGGAVTSDQSFDLRLLEPAYGAERTREYRLTEANCQPKP
jgi:hypothetical protein